VRERARELLGRDSESLSERNFIRILKDAHDSDVLDLRRRGDDFEVARAEAPSVSEQLAKAQSPVPPRAPDAAAPRLSIRGRGSGPRGRIPAVLPPELLSLGVVQAPMAPSGNGAEETAHEAPPAAAKRGRKRGGTKTAASPDAAEPAARAKRSRSRAKAGAGKTKGSKGDA
jgi:hypothetical protein